MNDKHLNFWLTFFSIITTLGTISFIFFMVFKETFLLKKEYCVILIPVLFFLVIQTIINYVNLTEK